MFWNPLTGLLSLVCSYAYRYLLLALLLSVFGGNDLLAQPANDSCAVAREILIPSQFGQTIDYQGSNIGATPELPLYYMDCSPGGLFSGFGADVWYRFTPNQNTCITITITGLSSPEFNVIENASCGQGIELTCVSGNNGNVEGSVEVNSGVTYFLRIGSGSYSDQNNFNLRITTYSCLEDNNSPEPSCLVSDRISFFPLPNQPGNTYEPGQEVNICYTIEQWYPISTNWIHSVEIFHGDGWDYSSLEYTMPQTCNFQGYWEWYDSWQSCATGEFYGPGFAYDSSQGLECGGFPYDGDPGNNWGDGQGQCESVPPIPREFCWTITVADCPPNPTSSSLDLSIEIRVNGDGDSGSWTINTCDDEPDETLSLNVDNTLCNVENCDFWFAFIDENPVSCPGEMDGYLVVNSPFSELGTFNVSVFTLNDELLYFYPGVTMPFVSPAELDTGYYGILVEAPSAPNFDYCNTGVIDIVHVDYPFEVLPRVIVGCSLDSIQLRGAMWPVLEDATFRWDGPNNFTSSVQDPFVYEDGTYFLTIRKNGCRISDSIMVSFRDSLPLEIDYFVGPPCADNRLQLTATGGSSYQWLEANTGQVLTPSYFPSQNLWVFGTIYQDLALRLVCYNPQG